MAVYQVDPLTDARWEEFIRARSDASAFHTRGWLLALQHTYGYEPLVYTTSLPGQPLQNGIPFCRIRSRLTGRRLVSLPFSDHCQPLFDSTEAWRETLEEIARSAKKDRLKYFEIRPLTNLSPPAIPELNSEDRFAMHLLDLTPNAETLLTNIHKNSRRNIKKSERGELAFEEGRSGELLDKFYRMMLITRRRHRLPPQPIHWFENLLQTMGEMLKIRIASKDNTPVAGILTLSFGTSMIYKYGCSDDNHDNLGGTFGLFWRAIQEAKNDGRTLFDLGRSDLDNEGLIQMKDRWGAHRSDLVYYRCPHRPAPQHAGESFKMKLARKTFSMMPDSMLIWAGRTLYKHKG